MSEDKQDNNNSVDSSDDTVMEQVTEERAVKKQGGYLGSLLLLVVLIGAGVAAWYYQAMWLPQAQQWWSVVMPKQASASVDPMAAPPSAGTAMAEQTQIGSASSGYAILPATPVKMPTEEITKEVVAETASVPPAPVAPAPAPAEEETAPVAQIDEVPLLAAPPSDQAVKDIARDVIMDEAPAIDGTHVASVAPEPTAAVTVTEPATLRNDNAANMVSLAQARQAFWAHDLVAAEAIYRQLIKYDPVVADAWGELGNLYYGQAKWPQAAEAYAEAAIQLLERNEYPQAMFLHYMVRGLDPEQAARIDAKLRAMQAAPRS